MNIQTERLADHTARFTVEVEAERLEKAKRAAAKKIARRVNIPGFRKGKAPYNILVNYIGEGAILEDALDELGNEVYKNALDQSDVKPYGPGSLENFELEPQPTFQFIVPLQPTVELGDYRDIRLDFEAPVIGDEDVEKGLKALQERHALYEESQQPIALGNRVTLDITGTYEHANDAHAHDDKDDDEDEDEDEAAEDAETVDEAEVEETEAEHEHEGGTHTHTFADQKDAMFMLTDDREPVPGFSAALVGAAVDDEREFNVTYPDDPDAHGDLSGKEVTFKVKVKKIETVTMPVLNDEFAARVTADEDEQLSLLELRMRIRKDLEEAAAERANSEYANKVLEKIVEGATASFPEALVADQINHMLQHVDSDLRQRGLTLEDYLKMTNTTIDDMRFQYRDRAVETIKRALVISELSQAEEIEVSEERVNEEIDRIVAQFGEQAAMFRSIYQRKDMQDNLRHDLTNRLLFERIGEIAKGNFNEAATSDEPASTEDAPAQEGE